MNSSEVPVLTLNGAKIYKGLLDIATQQALVDQVRHVAQKAPFFHPQSASGKNMSVKMTSAGRVGWISDQLGYRYEPQHPLGWQWPPIPKRALQVWDEVSQVTRAPDSCLINFYSEQARMGLHQDRDEGDFSFPVVSISLGDDAMFRIGGQNRSDPTKSIWLSSGDVVVLEGRSRLAYHGVDKLRFGSSALLSHHGRINLTMRVVTQV